VGEVDKKSQNEDVNGREPLLTMGGMDETDSSHRRIRRGGKEGEKGNKGTIIITTISDNQFRIGQGMYLGLRCTRGVSEESSDGMTTITNRVLAHGEVRPVRKEVLAEVGYWGGKKASKVR